MLEREFGGRLRPFVLIALLSAALLAVLTACRAEHPSVGTATDPPAAATASPVGPGTETGTEEGTDVGTDGSSATEGGTDPVTEPIYTDLAVRPPERAGAGTDLVLSASDYGAVGDGRTNDGPAIDRAVQDAVRQQATLRFERNATYYLGTSGRRFGAFKTPFLFQDADRVTVDGQGALFVVAPEISYAVLTASSDIRIENCRFACDVSAYLVGTVTGVSGRTVVYSVDRDPFLEDFDFTKVNGFSIRYNEGAQERPHRFLTRMWKTADLQVTAVYREDPEVAPGDLVFLPNPGVGHCRNEMIHIGGCSGALVLRNVQVHEAPSFIAAIKGNDAEIYLENVDFVPAADGRAISMVSWRDGWHCKDNRRPIHWKECDVVGLFDDVCNVSCTLGYVTEVVSGTVLRVSDCEMHQLHGVVSEWACRIGDIVDIYDTESGKYGGTARIREATPDGAPGVTTLVLDAPEPIQNLREGCVVANRATCAPGSTMTDCRFTGTFRFLRNLRAERCRFDLLAAWIMVEGSVEGPLPGNMDFVDCAFNGGYVQIDAFNRRTNRHMPQIGRKIGDIGFFGCAFNGTEIRSSSHASFTRADAWTEGDLFTVRNREKGEPPVLLRPSLQDFDPSVSYTWDRYTTDLSGGTVVPVSRVESENARRAIEASRGFSAACVQLQDGRLFLTGLSGEALPDLHQSGKTFAISFDYLLTSGAPAGEIGYTTRGGREVILASGVFEEDGRVGHATARYPADPSCDCLFIEASGGGTLYVGNLRVAVCSGNRPSLSQLRDGYTFLWSDEVTVGQSAEAYAVTDIPDAKAREAILGAEQGFTTGRALRLSRGFGVFTGLKGPEYYREGFTYRLSLDAYIRTPMEPPKGAKIYLIVLDGTPGNRVLASGLFRGKGFVHFDVNWTVRTTDEYGLIFYIDRMPKAYPDVYFGDFTATLLTH